MPAHPILLVAEDDPDDQYLFDLAMTAACTYPVEVHYLWNGLELMKILDEQANATPRRIKLVVLDLNMPLKDGRTVLQEMKASPRLADIPVAVLTTSSHPADQRFCEELGVVAYYQKPSSLDELRSIITTLCTRHMQN